MNIRGRDGCVHSDGRASEVVACGAVLEAAARAVSAARKGLLGGTLSGPGSNPHAARIATGEHARQGWPRLASLVGGEIASFGGVCWRTDARLGEGISRPDARRYHPESIARVRRQLRDAKIITSERVFVGGKIPSLKAKFTSSRGTTVKTFNWRAIEQKNPFTRRERRIKRQEQARATREAGELRRTAPRYAWRSACAPSRSRGVCSRRSELRPSSRARPLRACRLSPCPGEGVSLTV